MEKQTKLSATEIENKVITILEKELGERLFKNYISVGMRSNGEPKKLQFDIVSHDESIVGEVKSGFQYDSVRFAEHMYDCYRLMRVKNAKKRIFVLTNKDVYEAFIKDSDGLLEGIEVRFIELQ